MFERELDTYTHHLPELLQHEGKFAVIHDREVAGLYDSYEDAVAFGYDQFGLDDFLVKQIQAVEQVQFITRAVLPCPT
ncbi:MAG: hypothetical protein ABSH20_13240 [Tepidisphaeraceae bacterium]